MRRCPVRLYNDKYRLWPYVRNRKQRDATMTTAPATRIRPVGLGIASIAMLVAILPGSPAAAKSYTIRGHNNASYGAACKPNPNCVNWGGGVYTNGDTKVICTKKKCTMYEDDPPARTVPSGKGGQGAAGTVN